MHIPRALDTVISLRGVPAALRKSRQRDIIRGLPCLMDEVQRRVFDGEAVEAAIEGARPGCGKALSDEIEMVVLLMDAGVPMPEALHRVSERIDLPEFDLFATAASHGGGRNAVVSSLGKVSRALRERNRTVELLEGGEETAARSAAVLGLIPVAMLALITVAAHDHVAALLSTPGGGLAFSCSMALALIAAALMSLLGRADPGMTMKQAEAHVAALGRRTAVPMAVAVLPAMALLAAGPRMFGL